MKSLFKFAQIMVFVWLGFANNAQLIFIPQPNKHHSQPSEIIAPLVSPFSKFIGTWRMKENLWESRSNGQQMNSVDTAMLFIASSPTNQSLLWHSQFGSNHGMILWTYNETSKEVYHLSDFSSGPMAFGNGTIAENGDLELKLIHEGICPTCFALYRYKFVSEDEIYFRAVSFQDDKETGDYYGGTLIRKNK